MRPLKTRKLGAKAGEWFTGNRNTDIFKYILKLQVVKSNKTHFVSQCTLSTDYPYFRILSHQSVFI